MITASPRAVALRIIASRFAQESAQPTSYALAEYQHEAVARATTILRQRNGVIIADGVGLGKTFIAAALIEQHIARGASVVVVVPAALARPWRSALSPVTDVDPGSLHLVTHGQLSRGYVPGAAALFVVDEAHAFRNPRTRRYRALRLAARSARVVLLTATPVNNSLADLYFQLRLFATDDAFRDVGIGSLAMLLRPDDIDPSALARLHTAVMIRRSRADLRSRFPRIELPDGTSLRFPRDVTIRNLEYTPLVSCAVIQSFLDRMQFAVYSDQTSRILLALSLLKRIQSGRAAALVSVDRLIEFHRQFLDGIQRGFRLTPRLSMRDNDDQLLFTELLAEPVSPDFDEKAVSVEVTADLATLTALRSRLLAARDDKVDRLIHLLHGRSPPARTLVFTEFRDTAEDLWRSLRTRFQTGLITGKAAWLGDAPASRWDVIRRFAPAANCTAPPRPIDAVHVLVATDVLAEGLNLQDADAVVSFDLPWNPVRLIQRAGRIDRIGSTHDRVIVHNLIPDREFDQLIGLVRRLRAKLENIRAAVGNDSPVLETGGNELAWLSDVATGLPGILNDGATNHRPFDNELGNIEEAAPVGAVAAAESFRRVLVVLQSGHGAIRELVVQGGQVIESAEEVDRIIQTALRAREASCVPAGVTDAVELARSHLRAEHEAPLACARGAALSRVIQKAIQQQGVFARAELIAAAERALAAAPDLTEAAPAVVGSIRNARDPNELQRALERIATHGRIAAPTRSDFTLIAALAAD